MQFTYPYLLYGLLLLLIPIIVHLFQLRRFQKVAFTNVAFLKKATLQTRKSSELKRWLTLLTRMLALACIVLAFAQPVSSRQTDPTASEHTVIYLDNSFSMQAKGNSGSLLDRGIQDLYQLVGETDSFEWFTNSDTYTNASLADFRRQILQVSYTSARLPMEQVMLKARQLLDKNQANKKRIVLITDLQEALDLNDTNSTARIDLVRLSPVTTNNTTIDTAYLLNSQGQGRRLRVGLSHRGAAISEIPISLFKSDTLVAKTAVQLAQSESVGGGARQGWINFDLEQYTSFNGQLQIADSGLSYDNNLFFNWSEPNEVGVLIIEKTPADYLLPLYQEAGFRLSRQPFNNLNYGDISNQDFIILHELEEIPSALQNSLTDFYNSGGHLFLIPPELIDLDQYNSFLAKLGAGSLSSWVMADRSVSQINFDHPLYNNVFEREVTNFQYPSTSGYHRHRGGGLSDVLSFENGDAFLLAKERFYLSTTPFSQEWSTFQFSPLIVPTLYNMAQLSLPDPELFMEIGQSNSFAVPVSLSQDEILSIRDSVVNFIPLQQAKANSVLVTTGDRPEFAGTYGVYQNDQQLKAVSYNYSREESRLNYAPLPQGQDLNVYESVPELWTEIREDNQVTGYWKWFVTFAVLLLLIEMCVLKFIK